MEYLIMMVILFWVISSVLGVLGKRGSGTAPRHNRRPPGMPTFGGPDMKLPPVHQEPAAPNEAHDGRAAVPSNQAPSRSEDYGGTKEYRTSTTFGERTSRDFNDLKVNVPMRQPEPRIGDELAQYDLTKGGIGSDADADLLDQEGRGKPYSTGRHPLFNQKSVVNGFIWSEILGAPKSRRRM